MDINPISLKDLIEAIDKLTDLTKKLSGMLSSAIDRGAELIAWNHARQIKNELSDFLAGTIELVHGSNIRLIDLLVEPDFGAEGFSMRFDSEIRDAIASIMTLLRDLEEIKSSVASKEFYELMIATLRGREAILHQMRRMLHRKHNPASNSERQLVFEFETRYRELREQLIAANKALAAYIESLDKKSAWPKAT